MIIGDTVKVISLPCSSYNMVVVHMLVERMLVHRCILVVVVEVVVDGRGDG